MRTLFYCIALCLVFNSIQVHAQKSMEHYKRISYTTDRVLGESPTIDGKLDDEAWDQVPWAGNFRQSVPRDGDSVGQKTEFKVLYDDKNLYFGIRAYDTEPEKIVSTTVRHDAQGAPSARGHNCDNVEIFIAGDGDDTEILQLQLMVSGSTVDYYISGNGSVWDINYNPIWYGKTSIDSLGWIAEIKLPFSQLKFKNSNDQKFRLQVRRTIFRTLEEDLWQHIPADSPGWSHLVGDLNGISGVKKVNSIQIAPYVIFGARDLNNKPGNPFTRASTIGTAGVDGRIPVGNNLSLDFSLNPDFSQVEADPAIINLSGYQINYVENRPFFQENKNMVNLSVPNATLYYSRRIGARDFVGPTLPDSLSYRKTPMRQSIYSSVRLSGKITGKTHIFVQNSITEPEKGVIYREGKYTKYAASPLSSFSVVGLRRNIDLSNERKLLFLTNATAVNRNLNNEMFKNRYHSAAYSGGVDIEYRWKKQLYSLEYKGIGTYIAGSDSSIKQTQKNINYNFQREAGNVHIDSTLRSMAGTAMSLEFRKQGNFQISNGISYRSPKFATQDMGTLQLTDQVENNFRTGLRSYTKIGMFRELFVFLNSNNVFDTRGRILLNNTWVDLNGTFNNNSWISASYGKVYNNVTTTKLRGGPTFRQEPYNTATMGLGTSRLKPFSVSIDGFYQTFTDNISHLYMATPSLRYKNGRVDVTLSYPYSHTIFNEVYITTIHTVDGPRYILGRLKSIDNRVNLRFNYCVTPQMSIQSYLEFFHSVGKFTNIKKVSDNPTSRVVAERSYVFQGEEISYNKSTDSYNVLDHGLRYDVPNVDWLSTRVRSNLIFKWEYMKGAFFYVIWTCWYDNGWRPGSYTDAAQILTSDRSKRLENIFQVKYSYLLFK